ncbi:hypothetical protein SAMN05216259_108297 [Actinacidiphila guanduensis]|uniref:Secreted protein n=1 Tax=Actinacidiphila guanduensis TaxID=310781 RepID=A0A1H0I2D7_9ACTN|nr:hypothetical protein SAMN05216259_108297 [Actinacidiphila guanduensis]
MAGPRRLGAHAVVSVLLLAALCATAVAAAVNVSGDTSQLRDSVARRAAVAAQLRFALADLDAQRADTLAPGMSTREPGVYVGNQLNALITAQQRRAQVSDALRQLGSDEAHSAQVRTLLDGLGQYDDLSGRASYVDEQFPDRVAGHPAEASVAMNAQAGAVMTGTLLPVASALSADYQKQAADAAARVHDRARTWTLLVVLTGLLALLHLLWWQRGLARDYHRVFSVPLVAATAGVLATALTGAAVLSAAGGSAGTADRQGLMPWARLSEASTVAAQAAAAESRWFVHGAALGRSDAVRFTSLTRQLDGLLTPGAGVPADERPAYQDVRRRYQVFLTDDRHLRTLQAAGDTEQAAVVLTTVGRGDIAFDFWDFATTLDQLAARQLDDFTGHAADAHGALDGWPAIPAGATGVAALLVLLAVRPRLAEYR